MSAVSARETVTAWTDRLRAELSAADRPLREVRVLAETSSTQDAARRLGLGPGAVVAALRQRAGRGRLGRSWADTRDEGVALTLVLSDEGPPERVALAAAVGAACAAERLLGRRVGLKWPNDVVVGGRKLAGILVERADGLLRVGVGLNVGQTSWPPSLAGRAVSLAGLGAGVPRLEAAAALVAELNHALGPGAPRVEAAFRARSVLEGTRATFRSNGREITGTVLSVDPTRGLRVRTDRQEELYLPAAVTTVCTAPEKPGTGEPTIERQP